MIYDCFTFFNELDLLEVRLNEMADVVDRFVLVEARQTFQGDSKPLHFHENQQRFAKFLPKITAVAIDFPDKFTYKQTEYNREFQQNWNREFYQRDQIVQGLKSAKADDLIILSDVDEILDGRKLKETLRKRRKGDLTVFEMPMYSHFIDRTSHFRQRRDHSLHWLGPRLIEYCRFPGSNNLRSAKIFASAKRPHSVLSSLHTRAYNWINFRTFAPVHVVRNAGWHLNSIGGWQSWRTKVNSYSHAEYKELEIYHSETAFQKFVEESTDRADLRLLPRFIQQNIEKFQRFD